MNPFERSSLERVDLEKMHRRAEGVLEASRIQEKDFDQPYGEQTVAIDLQRVAELEKKFALERTPGETERKKMADILEAIILEHGELSNWFGESATTIAASKYDDYENGVDMIVEFRRDNPKSASFLGLAADVTFSSDTTRKFDRLREQIDRGELAKVKYFHSEYMNIHGQLGKLPEVVIGVDGKTLMDLAETWLERDNRALATHRVQIMILKQIRAQLDTFHSYATSIGQKEAAAIYRDRLKVIDEILETKKDIEKEHALELDTDHVYSEIMSFLKRWKQTLETATE